MPFKIKGGVPGQRISFEKEPNLDVGLWLYLKDGTHVRIQPVITENKTTVGGMRVDKNSVLRKGRQGCDGRTCPGARRLYRRCDRDREEKSSTARKWRIVSRLPFPPARSRPRTG